MRCLTTVHAVVALVAALPAVDITAVVARLVASPADRTPASAVFSAARAVGLAFEAASAEFVLARSTASPVVLRPFETADSMLEPSFAALPFAFLFAALSSFMRCVLPFDAP